MSETYWRPSISRSLALALSRYVCVRVCVRACVCVCVLVRATPGFLGLLEWAAPEWPGACVGMSVSLTLVSANQSPEIIKEQTSLSRDKVSHLFLKPIDKTVHLSLSTSRFCVCVRAWMRDTGFLGLLVWAAPDWLGACVGMSLSLPVCVSLSLGVTLSN